MNRDKQIEKVSKERREYLKFKPFADDLRKAESWCELDGVLNQYQTVKNLHKMGYRKTSDIAREIFAEIEKIKQYSHCEDCLGEWHEEGILFGGIEELKKKYESEKDNG